MRPHDILCRASSGNPADTRLAQLCLFVAKMGARTQKKLLKQLRRLQGLEQQLLQQAGTAPAAATGTPAQVPVPEAAAAANVVEPAAGSVEEPVAELALEATSTDAPAPAEPEPILQAATRSMQPQPAMRKAAGLGVAAPIMRPVAKRSALKLSWVPPPPPPPCRPPVVEVSENEGEELEEHAEEPPVELEFAAEPAEDGMPEDEGEDAAEGEEDLAQMQERMEREAAAEHPDGPAVPCRLKDKDVDLLCKAEKWGDIPLRDRQRILMAWNRAKSYMNPSAVARYCQQKKGKKGQNLSLLQEWALGNIHERSDLMPTVTQERSLVHRTDEEDAKGWLNLPELMHHFGGDVSKSQRRYVTQLWKESQGRPERRHPDGAGLPKQRRFHLASLETALRRREDKTAVNLTGLLQDPKMLEMLLAALAAPGLVHQPTTAVGTADSDEGEQRSSKRRRGTQQEEDDQLEGPGSDDNSEVEPPTRSNLLSDLYKVVPRLYAIRDKLPAGTHGDLMRAKLHPMLETVKVAKRDLEEAGQVPRSRLFEVAEQVKNCTTLATKLNKAMVQLSNLDF